MPSLRRDRAGNLPAHNPGTDREVGRARPFAALPFRPSTPPYPSPLNPHPSTLNPQPSALPVASPPYPSSHQASCRLPCPAANDDGGLALDFDVAKLLRQRGQVAARHALEFLGEFQADGRGTVS